MDNWVSGLCRSIENDRNILPGRVMEFWDDLKVTLRDDINRLSNRTDLGFSRLTLEEVADKEVRILTEHECPLSVSLSLITEVRRAAPVWFILLNGGRFKSRYEEEVISEINISPTHINFELGAHLELLVYGTRRTRQLNPDDISEGILTPLIFGEVEIEF